MEKLLSDLVLSDRGFVFAPSTGETFEVSPSALLILRKLQAGETVEAILMRLVGDYSLPLAQAKRDLDSFLDQLEELGWTA